MLTAVSWWVCYSRRFLVVDLAAPRYCAIFVANKQQFTTLEEKNLSPAETFFIKKAEFEHSITEAVKSFAGTYATDVAIKVAVAVQPALTTSGDVVDCKIKGVEIEAKYTQNV